ncbi:hypothetical protein EJB05_46432, partial [Eragrostis curvula]
MAARQPPPVPLPAPAAGVSMKEYLKRYESGARLREEGEEEDEEEAQARRGGRRGAHRRRGPRVAEARAARGGRARVIRIGVGFDCNWETTGPLVDEDIEVKRNAPPGGGTRGTAVHAIAGTAAGGSRWQPQRVAGQPAAGTTRRHQSAEAMLRRTFLLHGEGGAAIRPSPERGDIAGKDLSPPRQRGRRQDTPSPKGMVLQSRVICRHRGNLNGKKTSHLQEGVFAMTLKSHRTSRRHGGA